MRPPQESHPRIAHPCALNVGKFTQFAKVTDFKERLPAHAMARGSRNVRAVLRQSPFYTAKIGCFWLTTKQIGNFKSLIINKLVYRYILTFCYNVLIISRLCNCLIINGLAPLRVWNESVSPLAEIFHFFLKIFVFRHLVQFMWCSYLARGCVLPAFCPSCRVVNRFRCLMRLQAISRVFVHQCIKCRFSA